MGFRGPEATLRARILELEEENARLRAEVDRLSGKTALTDAPPVPVANGVPIWSPGDSWLVGWEPSTGLLAYTGENVDDQHLRFLWLLQKRNASYELAENGARCVARLNDMLLAGLKDGSLAFFSWPSAEIAQRVHLHAPLVAQPILNQAGEILAVTASRELLVIDPTRLVVKSWSEVDPASLRGLGFPEGDARQTHNGYSAEERVPGWNLDAYRDVGSLRLCSLSRSFAGNEEMGACAFRRGASEPLWVRHAGGGNFIYLYGLDRLLVIHNVSLEVPSKTYAYWQESGELVLTISGRKPEAKLDVYDGDGSVLACALL
jgi:hypothetical protein